MNKCLTCGEYKPCRKIVEYCSETGYPYLFARPISWRCKDCDDYFEYLFKQEKLRDIEKRKQFIKKRNKILIQIKEVKE